MSDSTLPTPAPGPRLTPPSATESMEAKHLADAERLTRYRDAIDEAHTAWRAFNAIRDLTIPTAPKTASGYEPHMDEINREDFCALLGIVNDKLGNALELASGRGAQ